MTGAPPPGADVALCLVSHTNAGKTTLARTLTRRDVGEVADRAHVTEQAERHLLVADGDARLWLWDTPGFGDSVRLVRRLRAHDRPLADPVGWFLQAAWDRVADRPFWCGQQALRTVREASDLVLYLANAAEDPATCGWLGPELALLEWLGRPAIVLLNQLGTAADPAAVAADARRWADAVAGCPAVIGVLPFDAFARCWVQEHVLLEALAPHVAPAVRGAFGRLASAWRARDRTVLDAAAAVIAAQLARAAADAEPVGRTAAGARVRSLLGRLGGRAGHDVATEAAAAALEARLDVAVRESTDALVRLHGLAGTAGEEILTRLGAGYVVARGVDPDSAGVVGGLVSGALGGLAADLAAGGLTLGAGAVLGGLLGAWGARGAARAWNEAYGGGHGRVRWSAEFMEGRVAAALARYLAVAHFGRGRGEWRPEGAPAHWQAAIAGALARRRDEFAAVWHDAAGGAPAPALEARLGIAVRAALGDVLRTLYPEAAAALD